MSQTKMSPQELIDIERELTEVMKHIYEARNSGAFGQEIGRDIAVAHTHVETAVAYFRAYIVPFARAEIEELGTK